MKLIVRLHKDGDWFVGHCPAIPEANGQGKTEDECIASLLSSIELLMEDSLASADFEEGTLTRELVLA
jgi:predicted RNase H-like HicB family nuclease